MEIDISYNITYDYVLQGNPLVCRLHCVLFMQSEDVTAQHTPHHQVSVSVLTVSISSLVSWQPTYSAAIMPFQHDSSSVGGLLARYISLHHDSMWFLCRLCSSFVQLFNVCFLWIGLGHKAIEKSCLMVSTWSSWCTHGACGSYNHTWHGVMLFQSTDQSMNMFFFS